VYDENTGLTFIIHIVCVCGTPMAKLKSGTDDHACPHCDIPCYAGDCKLCHALEQFDYFLELKYNDDDEEEDEDDADL
jgi:hypothetical protein